LGKERFNWGVGVGRGKERREENVREERRGSSHHKRELGNRT
jgi:hypothetical protein